MNLLSLFKNIILILILVSYSKIGLQAGENNMFEMSNYSEWGGLMIEFTDGRGATSSFTINKDDKIIKITSPNRKGAFEWSKIKCLHFNKTQHDQGELSIYFNENYPGTDNGKFVIGIISKSLWDRITQNTMGEIEITNILN